MDNWPLPADPDRLVVRIFMLIRDDLPPTRPDLMILFGKELPRLGVYTDLVGLLSADSQSLSARWEAGCMHVVGRASRGPLLKGMRVWAEVRGLFRCLDDKHDVVQVRDKTVTALIGLAGSYFTRKAFVYWMSFPFAEGYAARGYRGDGIKGYTSMLANRARAALARFSVDRIILPFADHVFVQSEAMRDYVVAKGIAAEFVTAVPMGVDTESFYAGQLPTVLPVELVGRRVVAYLGVVALARRSEFLLDVVRSLRTRIPEVLLLVVGDGASASECLWFRQQIDEHRLTKHVLLTGWLPQAEALTWVRYAEIGLSPIPRGVLYDVSSPTKAVEYLALGIPCVGNDIPDQRQVLESSGGGICLPMEVDLFADALRKLLDDKELRLKMGKAGQEWVFKNRSYDKLAQVVAPIYQAVVDRQRRSQDEAK